MCCYELEQRQPAPTVPTQGSLFGTQPPLAMSQASIGILLSGGTGGGSCGSNDSGGARNANALAAVAWFQDNIGATEAAAFSSAGLPFIPPLERVSSVV